MVSEESGDLRLRALAVRSGPVLMTGGYARVSP